MTKEPKLEEIELTPYRGFVLKDAQEEVEILGGMTTGRVTKNTPEEIRLGIEDTIKNVYAEQVPKGTNGYIIHGSVQIKEADMRIPLKDREVMTHFSAVKYKKR